ncbi:MAG: hypothetical protein EBR23_07105 [Planctomycetia bacterium]|nr:hypothetical protein [Planctomycetia bacterium]
MSGRQEFERDIDEVRTLHEDLVRGAGGTPGGTWLFFAGLVLAAVGLWFFLSNVHVMSEPFGMVSGFLGNRFGGATPAMSTGAVFVPVFAGLVLLFYDARLKWGWALVYVGLAIIVIDILSRIRFQMGMPVSNLLLMLGMVAAGIGMMLRSFRDKRDQGGPSRQPPDR